MDSGVTKDTEKSPVSSKPVPPRQIAMIGTAPSTRSLAPFEAKDWEIWGQADYWADMKQVNRWFEFAPMHKLMKEFPDYLKYLMGAKFPIWMRQEYPDVPTSKAFPFNEIANEFGPEFMSATLCWMIGMAIREHTQGQTVGTIGLWGYDLALDGEYHHQRPGLRHMQWICENHLQAKGFEPIKIFVPMGSDLTVTPLPYPFADDDPMVAKIRARKRDLIMRIQQTEAKINSAKGEIAKAEAAVHHLRGALEDVTYFERMAVGTKHPAG